jgi:mRNA-degrading endonuclease RelE of RelBE toxin-antitoxin system
VAKTEVLLNPRFLAALKNLAGEDVDRIEETLRLLPECFGQPHLHGGISIRRLRKNIFECRVGLKVWLLFRAHPPALEVFFAGNHDEVRRLLRSL